MRFKFLFIWVIFQLSVFALGFLLQKNNSNLAQLNKLAYSVYISRGAGLCLSVTPTFLLIPVCRHTTTFARKMIPALCKIIPNFSMSFHKLCAHTILFWSVVHMVGHFINFYGVEYILKINTMYNLHYTIFAGISGHIMMIALFFIFLFSGIYFRKYNFEIFWMFHHFFIILFISYMFHGIGCFVRTDRGSCLSYYSGVMTLPAVFIYATERIIREFRPLRTLGDILFYDKVYKIYIEKTFDFKPGQYLILKCPDVSKYQWHPFTISSSPEESHLEITIRRLGNWTSAFQDLSRENLKKNKKTLIQIDGPFGSPIDTYYLYKNIVFVAAGVGITPYISILKHILYLYKTDPNFDIKRIDIIWINRDIEYFEWFNHEFDSFYRELPQNLLNFHIYLTEPINDPDKIHLIANARLPHLNFIYKTKIPINYGRPDFDLFVKKYSSEISNAKVGCFVCCSHPIEGVVKSSCLKYSNKDIQFDCRIDRF